ncbi:Trypsin [compost metagenome]
MKSLKSSSRLNYIMGLMIFPMALIGCSEGGSDDPGAPVRTYEFQTVQQLEEAWSGFDVTCEGSCPESSGSLLSKSGTSLSTCSFSLVGKDIILTNRHCIPEDIAQQGAPCEGVVQAIFVKDDRSKEIYACDKVLSIPKDYGTLSPTQERDFAFLKLKKSPTGRQPLKVATSGLVDQETLTAITSTPKPSSMNGGPGATLIKKTCKVHMNSMAVDGFTNGFKSVAAFKNCDIVSGNSGSAMVDQDGNLKAVAQANFLNSQNVKSTSELIIRLSEVLKNQKFAIGTNILCIENDELKLYPKSMGCDMGTDTYTSKISERLFDKKALGERLTKHIDLLNEGSEFFIFKVKNSSSADGTSFTFEPGCIKGSKDNIPWLTKYEKKALLGLYKSYPETTFGAYIRMELNFVTDVDDNARVHGEFISPYSNITRYTNFEVPVAKIANQDQENYQVKLLTGDFYGGTRVLNLPMCNNHKLIQ